MPPEGYYAMPTMQDILKDIESIAGLEDFCSMFGSDRNNSSPVEGDRVIDMVRSEDGQVWHPAK